MTPFQIFKENIKRSKKFIRIYKKQHKNNDDILRACLVFTMATLDAYIHQIISDNIVNFIKINLKNSKERKNSERDRKIKMDRLSEIKKLLESLFEHIDYIQMLEKDRPFVQFRKKFDDELYKDTYQNPKKIAEAFKLFDVYNFWDEFKRSGHKNSNLDKIPGQLEALFKKRNQIVHEMDRNRSRKRKNREQEIKMDDCTLCLNVANRIVMFVEKYYLNPNQPGFILQ
jgi:hypothetical protein